MNGTLTILDQITPRVIEFNGVPEEREAVKAEFERLMDTGNFLAYQVEEKTREKRQIRRDEFPIKDPNPEVVLTPHLVGG